MSIIRAMYISDDITRWDDSRIAPTPKDSLTDLPKLLSRVVNIAHPNGMTILLSGSAATALGFPAKLPEKQVKDHPTLNAARTVGWRVDSITPWMTCIRGSSDIHLGVLPWLNARNFPFYEPTRDVMFMVDSLYRYHRMLGVPYYGVTPGLPGISLLRDHHNGRKPMWQPRNWDAIEPATNRATELAPMWESNEPHGDPYEHMYDARRQFLTTAGYVTLALGELVHTRRAEISMAPAPGYYLVTTPAWALGHVLPHPIGNAPMGGQRRWVTAPTLALMFELADGRGILDYPQVHDAWIAEPVAGKPKTGAIRTGRPMHRWATTISKALDVAEATKDKVMKRTLAETYKHAIGLLQRPGGRIYRPDWAHTIIAQARANQFRKILGTWYASQRPPVRVEADQVWYSSQAADGELNWPIDFKRAIIPDAPPVPGGYTLKSSRTLETPR